MKKIISLAIMLFLLFGAYGCGSIDSKEGLDLLESAFDNLYKEERMTITINQSLSAGEEEVQYQRKLIRTLGENPKLYIEEDFGAMASFVTKEWYVIYDEQYLILDKEGDFKGHTVISEENFWDSVNTFVNLGIDLFGSSKEDLKIEGSKRLFRNTILEVESQFFKGEVKLDGENLVSINGIFEIGQVEANLNMTFEAKANIPTYNIDDFLVF